ncbi:MAG: DNA topoisomerase VI subunit B [Gammaproteobacteria bacterium]|nr:DNA topoisomerase VI subunit B [Gammaproteobacteria bacterium]
MAARQRNIAVSEFFLKNRHLLGFDSPHKAILTTVKEAVDNALDACEEASILPDICVEIMHRGDDRYLVAVEDNGPGIVDEQIARIFGKLLYGSKFHQLRQSRGQQGMGISAAGMYGQLTTGRPMRILSRIESEKRASEMLISIDTSKNRPDIHSKRKVAWRRRHGTRVEVELEGHYTRGQHSVEMYLKQTAIANPHVTLRCVDPGGKTRVFRRSTDALPPLPRPIKPHPHGVELGRLIQMLHDTPSRTLKRFLEDDFSRVGTTTARRIIERTSGRLSERSNPRRIAHARATQLHRAIRHTRVSAPRTDCIVPIGEKRLLEGLRKELDADFFLVITRPPSVYGGNPFQVEIGIAWGRSGGLALAVDAKGRIRRKHKKAKGAQHAEHADQAAHLLRFANRVPLLYQQSACAITKAVAQTNWRAYGLKQPKGALPIAPMVIFAHVASVWVPFTSESKEAVAPLPEISRELVLALQEAGRQLAAHIRRDNRLEHEYEKRAYIESYLPHVGLALQDILELSDRERNRTVARLDIILHRSRKS